MKDKLKKQKKKKLSNKHTNTRMTTEAGLFIHMG